MTQLKVYGGLRFQTDGKQHRIVIALPSKTELARFLGVGMYIVNTWWSETSNSQETEKALANPRVFIDMGKI